MKASCDLLLKVAVIGPSGSGKSSLLRAIQRGPPYTSSSDAERRKKQDLDFSFKTFQHTGSDGVVTVANVTFWDVAGSALDSTALQTYLCNCHALLLVVDADSTAEMRVWVEKLKELDVQTGPRLLLATKRDLPCVAEPDWLAACGLSEETGQDEVGLLAVSAMSGEGVERAVDLLLDKVVGRAKQQKSVANGKANPAALLDTIQQSKREFQRSLAAEKRRAMDRLFMQLLNLLLAVGVVGLAYAYYTHYYSAMEPPVLTSGDVA